MKLIKLPVNMQKAAGRLHFSSKRLGFVPTMGALHSGHVSLINRARKDNDAVAVSIFVNPTQFGPREDYLRYPRPLDRDIKTCAEAGVDYLFVPEVSSMYGENFQSSVAVGKLQNKLCGRFRPGHFGGVATVVLKLLNIVMPDAAYFGEKDFQQLAIIRRIAEDFNLQTRIVGCKIIRERGGLALSSRNVFLSPAERFEAVKIYKSLKVAADLIRSKRVIPSSAIKKNMLSILKSIPNHKLEYISIVNPTTLEDITVAKPPVLVALAMYLGRTRLIDNILVSHDKK